MIGALTLPRLLPFAILLLVGAISGCGGSSGSHVSGKVTFKGQPVPTGKIMFLPDSAAGNSGQAGFADIKDGVYDTSAVGGQGTTPGANVVRIEGIDPNPPPGAEPDVTSTILFSGYEVKMDVPESKSTKDFDVPEDAAKPKPVQGERAVVTP
jgi:hypothetical protein